MKAAEKRAAPAAGNADSERIGYQLQIMPTQREYALSSDNADAAKRSAPAEKHAAKACRPNIALPKPAGLWPVPFRLKKVLSQNSSKAHIMCAFSAKIIFNKHLQKGENK